MSQHKRDTFKEKTEFHTRNKHRERYDFNALVKTNPELATYVRVNNYDGESIDFSNADAVKALNKALLLHFYELVFWDIPPNYLCPPIPGRADYIHHIADLLKESNHGVLPKGNLIRCLDIGVGANCIYPIIGVSEYAWSFVGSDIDPIAIKAASKNIESNPNLQGKIDLRLQRRSKNVFKEIVNKDEYFDITICNPPFHGSFDEAKSGTLRKLSNLNRKRINALSLNFGGKNTELWCEGGEERFVKTMVTESKHFSANCYWFSTLISKQANLKFYYKALEFVGATEIKTINMQHGNKVTRILVWTFLTKEKQREWAENKWSKR